MPDDALIDVRDLIARYSAAEHVSRADAYFASMPDNPLLLRKPFFGLRDTQANMHGVAEILSRLQLFPGAVVLDFGAGTGWLSKALAYIDCRPIAMDVSAAALAIGRRAFEADPVATGLSVDWRSFDGITIPLDDDSVDRIVCFDSFHHVADQAATLKEFYRVLRDGGRVVFHEPGPDHSKAAQSQYEMRHHDVIENDIVLETIWQSAEPLGFSGLRIAPATPVTAGLTLDSYNRIRTGKATPEDTAAVLETIVAGAANLRIFSLDKGEQVFDSRHGEGLAGEFKIWLTSVGPDTLQGRAKVTNTGHVRWRASGNEAGCVSLGVKLRGANAGSDYGRVKLSGTAIDPGQTVEIAFTLPTPPALPAELVFDLVAEFVTWFETKGSTPVIVPVTPPPETKPPGLLGRLFGRS
ncbi:class I SAM-dependent methyltransferase [Acidisphaera sp. L21]|uniref:class I SAM-dependent methyltransferase n=1 Tax=Acidisphaera sp. L21 TaxID=1641851 RepID=UPI00131C118A|nr:class I SAM-dependent methyltransferase [Acidisphaera sp. L21]